jgi:hypothetical protein
VATTTTEISLQEFRVRAAHTGMTLTEDDIVLLHKGYVGLMRFMERFPKDSAPEAESSHVFKLFGEVAR